MSRPLGTVHIGGFPFYVVEPTRPRPVTPSSH